MCKITKKVDKPQTTILFLVMIGIMFFGQAISDFIKKKKNQSQRPKHPVQHSAPKPKPRSAPARPQTITVEKPTEAQRESAAVTCNTVNVAETAPENPAQTVSPDSEELRKAVIWSEILKRKF